MSYHQCLVEQFSMGAAWFCKECSSQLFYETKRETKFSLAAGRLDESGGLTIEGQLFINSQPDCSLVNSSKVAEINGERLHHYKGKDGS